MLDDHLKAPGTRARLRAGPTAPYIDDFADWLDERGYKWHSMRGMLQGLAAWMDWLQNAAPGTGELLLGYEAYAVYLRGLGRTPRGKLVNQASLRGASKYIQFLQLRGVLVAPPPPISPLDTWPILRQYCSWASQACGLAETTLTNYRHDIITLLEACGSDPRTYSAENLRAFVIERTRPHGVGRAKYLVSAVRSFVRYLVSTEKCDSGLRYAIPGFKCRSYASPPRYLPPEDVERIIAACAGTTPKALRDTAVVLLLARLGLRASEAAKLSLTDIDWRNGRIAVCGKSRRQEWLPLPQDVGDALLEYLRRGRPEMKGAGVFWSAKPPIRPLTGIAVTHIVYHAIARAGVKSPVNGAYVLRHSLATHMLRSGASLAGIGAVLRHRVPITTLHYAKIDFGTLTEVTHPWPEEKSC